MIDYQYFDDSYDFLAVFTSVGTASRTNFHASVRNDVMGIGRAAIDFTSNYGSGGRLRGMSFHSDTGAGALTHELMHQWGVSLDPALELGSGHWGAVNIRGYLFGLDFSDNNDGTYTITRSHSGTIDGSPDWEIPPIELYLMGLISPGQVPDITVLQGVVASSVRAGDIVTPTGMRVVTIDDIVAVHGPSSPWRKSVGSRAGVFGSQARNEERNDALSS